MTNQFLAFDAVQLRDKIVEKLNDGKVFTDQNYQGSNISALIDVISMAFGTLLFYNSKTSSEAMFSEAQLYENMNKIVKILNYNPVGRVAQNIPFSLKARQGLSMNSYVIPRYSYVNIGGTSYTLTEDLTFSKLTNGVEIVEDVANNYLLHEGTIQEYPMYKAIGVANEVVYLGLNSNVIIDHFSIFAYVKQGEQNWETWRRVEDRSLYASNDRVFEVRFNANKRYELIFGDDVNGKQLNTDDSVAIYFLSSNPNAATLGSGALDNFYLIPFISPQFLTILDNVKSPYGIYLTPSQYDNIGLLNTFPSSNYSEEESVDSIRKNAPKVFRSQHRLVTATDYESFVKSNFSNLLADSKIVTNDEYLKGHLKYLYEIGLNSPQLESSVLYNQVKFANSCNFNNIYMYTVPKRDLRYLSGPQKEYILNQVRQYKTMTSQVVPMDPEYMYFDFFVNVPDVAPNILDISQNKLRIYKDVNTRRSNSAMKLDIVNLILNYFNPANIVLGQDVDTHQMTTDILSIDGVKSLDTYRTKYDVAVKEISFLVWNSKHPRDDIKTYTQTVNLEFFMYPLLYNAINLGDRIEIVDQSNSIKVAEF